MAVTGDHRPFAITDNAAADASPEAAVAAAAHRVLVHFLPNQQATIIDPAFTASLATLPDGQSKTHGVALGERVASALIALRADDEYRSTAYPYTPPDPPVPGVWLPTAPPPAQPLGTYLGHMRPFALDSTDQFRPSGPPHLGSKRWARDYNEVKSLGSSASTTRTPEQTETARFWAEPPVQQMHAAFRGVIAQHTLDIADATRFMAMATVTVADAAMACFDAKYHYAFWRPVIQRRLCAPHPRRQRSYRIHRPILATPSNQGLGPDDLAQPGNLGTDRHDIEVFVVLECHRTRDIVRSGCGSPSQSVSAAWWVAGSSRSADCRCRSPRAQRRPRRLRPADRTVLPQDARRVVADVAVYPDHVGQSLRRP